MFIAHQGEVMFPAHHLIILINVNILHFEIVIWKYLLSVIIPLGMLQIENDVCEKEVYQNRLGGGGGGATSPNCW